MGEAGNNKDADLGFESQLWRAADALRSNMDAAEYKHVVLGLIFLKYISDAFGECARQHTLRPFPKTSGELSPMRGLNLVIRLSLSEVELPT